MNREKSLTALFMAAAVGGTLLSAVYWVASLVEQNGSEARSAQSPRQTVTIVINSLGISFPEGLDENHNPYLDYIERHTDLDINVIIPPSEGYEEKLNVIMASGNWPDMINVFDAVWVVNYAKQNALMPLDDLIDKYGPDLKRRIPPEAWDRVRYNGKIYAVPSLNEVRGVELMYGRKDWLDKLGLKPPSTLDEYYDVMKAFVESDPDGNGKRDTYGVVMTENLGRSAPFFGAFGIQLDQWVERDGKLVYSNTLPEMKEALSFLAKLYRDGLLDPMFPLNKNHNLEEKIVSGKVGLYSAAWYDTRGPIAQNMKNDPDAEWIPLDYPTGPRGENGVYSTDFIREYEAIPAGSKHAEAVIRMLNFIAGDGYRDLKLGFENEIWRRVDGKIVTNFEEHNKHQYRGIYQSLVEIADPEILKVRLDSLGEHFRLYDNLLMIERHLIPNRFTGLPTPAMAKYQAKLGALRDVFIKMIVGVVPIDEFDEYVERWKREGGDEVTREVNEWFEQKKQR